MVTKRIRARPSLACETSAENSVSEPLLNVQILAQELLVYFYGRSGIRYHKEMPTIIRNSASVRDRGNIGRALGIHRAVIASSPLAVPQYSAY
jgi:hypothetical protein